MPDSDNYLEADFPNLRSAGWQQTSDSTPRYNCIAYAANDTRRWWEPRPHGGYYWPPTAKREDTIEGWKSAFEAIVYKVCPNADLESDYEKIAIYARGDVPTHVARQKVGGIWTSKLGPDEDIDHNTVEALECDIYGIVTLIMKRVRHS